MAHEHLIKGDYNDISSCHHLAFLGQPPSCKSLEVADPGSITRKQNGEGVENMERKAKKWRAGREMLAHEPQSLYCMGSAGTDTFEENSHVSLPSDRSHT